MQIVDGNRVAIVDAAAVRKALINYLTAVHSGVRADIYQHVGSLDNLLVMLHNDDSVAQVAEPLQHTDELLGVAGMQADGRLVKDVKRADKVVSEGADKVDALAFAAAQGIGRAGHGQIAKTDIHHIAYPHLQFFQRHCHLGLFVIRKQGVK